MNHELDVPSPNQIWALWWLYWPFMCLCFGTINYLSRFTVWRKSLHGRGLAISRITAQDLCISEHWSLCVSIETAGQLFDREFYKSREQSLLSKDEGGLLQIPRWSRFWRQQIKFVYNSIICELTAFTLCAFVLLWYLFVFVEIELCSVTSLNYYLKAKKMSFLMLANIENSS